MFTNYLHDSHIRYGLRIGADVICEKPLVLNPWNVDALLEIEKEYTNKVNAILQLRCHKTIISLKESIDKDLTGKIYEIDLTYITARGNWYYSSWKGDEDKSGGIATNIGIHFFDMLIWIFGKHQSFTIQKKTNDTISGTLRLKKANVNWFLSINPENLPSEIKDKNISTHRILKLKVRKLILQKDLLISIQ